MYYKTSKQKQHWMPQRDSKPLLFMTSLKKETSNAALRLKTMLCETLNTLAFKLSLDHCTVYHSKALLCFHSHSNRHKLHILDKFLPEITSLSFPAPCHSPKLQARPLLHAGCFDTTVSGDRRELCEGRGRSDLAGSKSMAQK